MSAAAQQDRPPAPEAPREVRIISHSMLFYWWPVWAVGLLMALLTVLGGNRLAVVPAGTVAERERTVPGFNDPRDVLVAPAGAKLLEDQDTGALEQPTLHVASHSGYGVIFVVVLLLVIFITNVPVRGMVSVVAIITLVLLSIILALTRAWDSIFAFLDHSHIYLNAFGYLAIAVPLLVLWLLAVLVFDRQAYMVFVPGQLRVCQHIGGGETAYDARGMVVEKIRSDLFRHWLLGIGSGDLIVKTGGSSPQQFQMPNVLFVGHKLQLIQQMLQQREMVSGR
jgi:hypothetical protein